MRGTYSVSLITVLVLQRYGEAAALNAAVEKLLARVQSVHQHNEVCSIRFVAWMIHCLIV